MLTSDLLRYEIENDQIYPKYIARKKSKYYLKICHRLIQIFQKHIGRRRGELEDALAVLETSAYYKIVRGLSKLIFDKAEFESIRNINYPELRRSVFKRAQQNYPIVSRPDLIHTVTHRNAWDNIAHDLHYSPQELGNLLYGDLPNYQILRDIDKNITPRRLLRRYNLALAQGVLFHAREMVFQLYSNYKDVFRYIKLARLIHQIESVENGYKITLNGPASTFKNTRRYGIRLAMFLPGLLLADQFEMTALVETRESGVKRFSLNQDSGLHTYYRSTRHPFDSAVEEMFYRKFSKRKNTEWTIHRETEIIDLKDTVFIPDFTFIHSDGSICFMEIVGFWTPEYLQKKLDKLNRSRHQNMIIAVNETLNCSRKDFKTGEVIFFKTGIRTGKVLGALEEIRVED